MHKWFVYNDFNETSKQAADFIAEKIQSSIERNNICHVVLPGGNTPAQCLSYLVNKKLSWHKVHWYLGDERCYALCHSERNDVMLDNNFWSHLIAPNIHVIAAELGAEEAAKAYRKLIRNIDKFDIAFLGMGEDGHTASLFPENDALLDTRSVVPVYNSPKPPSDRVSLSITTLSKADCRVVLATGAEKAAVIKRIRNGEMLPINQLGDINWFVDESAVSACQ